MDVKLTSLAREAFKGNKNIGLDILSCSVVMLFFAGQGLFKCFHAKTNSHERVECVVLNARMLITSRTQLFAFLKADVEERREEGR